MKRIAALIVLAVCASTAGAHSSVPISWSHEIRSIEQVQTRSLEALDLQQLAAEDAFLEAVGGPPRFAVDHDAGESPARSAAWDEAGEYSIWRYRVLAKDAASLNFGFTRFHLPKGSALYIYSSDREHVAGPYTAAHNKAHGQLWTPILAAQDVTIELNVPTAVRHQVDLELGKINQGYRGFGTAIEAYRQPELDLAAGGKACSKEGGARSGACNTDVACLSDGDPWNDPRRSVGAYSRSGVFACTGSLVNNTANDRRMLFMTATHCINAGQAPSIVVYWNYEWPTCRRPGAAGGTSVNPPDPSMTNSGGTWLAATTNPFSGGGCTVGSQCSDVTLIELDDPADPNFDLYWSGWDRRPPPTACAQGTPNTTEGLCASIHHPGVDEKRITFVAQDIQVGNIAAATGVHWHPFWHPNPPELPNMPAGGALPPSVTEGGSSGSPLYTAEQRFIGVLSGGPAFCGATGASLSDFYGQLAHAWDGIGTPTTRVRDYLDPSATAPLFIDGLGASPFSLSADPASLALCASDGSADVSIDVDPDPGFTDPVDLSASGQPPGSSVSFLPASVSPPGSSTLTLGSLGAATPGDYVLVVTGESGGDQSSTSIAVSLSSAALGATVLVAPADGDPAQPEQPTLEWDDNGDAIDYLVEVATDDQFNDIVFTDVVEGTSVEVDPGLAANTTYWWRVTARNHCGDGAVSAVRSFFVIGADLIFANGFEEPVDPDIIEWSDINHPIMADISGTSIRWITGEVIDDDPDDNSWDINFYASGGALTIWWNFAPAISAGVTASPASSNLSVLSSGAVIGPASTFSRTSGAMTDWRAGASGYVGFRFDCSSLPTAPPDDTCYGYLQFQTTGATGFPATIIGWAYNRAGNPITVP